MLNISCVRVHVAGIGMNGPTSIMKASAVGLVLLIIGLIVGYQIGVASSSAPHGPSSTKPVFVTTTSQVQAPVELVEHCFSPGGNCASIVVKWINRANSSVHVLIYSFTLDAIRDSLIDAKNRGVDVKIVMERSNANEKGAEYQNLKNAGVDIRLDTNSGLMHDKVAVIDGHIVLTGSMNWSNAGVRENNENLLVLNNEDWASAYEGQFEAIYEAAQG